MQDTVLITGCSSGIGRATARAFLEENWTVYASSRDPADVVDLAERGCETPALDVTDEERPREVIESIVENEGRLDCLVNNAGYAQAGPIEDVPIDRVHHQFDVNVYGPHRLIRAALPHMRSRRSGTIVNVSSIAGRITVPGLGVYCASKNAFESMSDALRAEVSEFDVDVVVVEPGIVETKFIERLNGEVDPLPRSGAYDSLYRILEDVDLLDGTLGTTDPRDVGDVIVNAASSTQPDARYMVGSVAKASEVVRFVPPKWRDSIYRLVASVAGR